MLAKALDAIEVVSFDYPCEYILLSTDLYFLVLLDRTFVRIFKSEFVALDQ